MVSTPRAESTSMRGKIRIPDGFSAPACTEFAPMHAPATNAATNQPGCLVMGFDSFLRKDRQRDGTERVGGAAVRVLHGAGAVAGGVGVRDLERAEDRALLQAVAVARAVRIGGAGHAVAGPAHAAH